MASTQGCLKVAGIGCLGLIVVLVVGGGIVGLTARQAVERQAVEDVTASPAGAAASQAPAGPGRVVLDLRHGSFTVKPAPQGEGVSVSARYDTTSYELVDELVELPDGRWEYRVGFRSTIPLLKAMVMELVGDVTDPEVTIALPRDVKLDLDMAVDMGGVQAELGGLWLRTADFRFDKGGFELMVGEPMREPMESLSITGSMGGVEAGMLGNASPAVLTVACRMGGAELDLRGDWRQDGAVSVDVDMGGIAVIVPRELEVTGAEVSGVALKRTGDPEVPLPRLRLDLQQNRGEIEVVRQ